MRAHSELLFVAHDIDDLSTLLSGVREEVSVCFIGAEEDAVLTIGEVLRAYPDCRALHILAHSGSGEIRLGATPIDRSALRDRASDIEDWRRFFESDAEILIYGCTVAAGEKGKAFTESLADLTGCRVAASGDPVGSAAQGGTWSLVEGTNPPTTALPFETAARDAYPHLLAVIPGTSGDDTLTGGPDNDSIDGGAGNDSLLGLGGDDQISGGNGADTIDGGPGNDRLYDEFPNAFSIGGADSADDLLIGGDGNDFIESFAGNDTVFGGLGNDDIRGGALVEAGGGDDTVRFGGLVYGNPGNDVLWGSEVYGGSGNDLILFAQRNLQVGFGNDGEDTLLGDSPTSVTGGRNLLDGGADNDLLVGDRDASPSARAGGAADTLIGGDGRDTLYGDDSDPIPVTAPVGGGNDDLFGGLGNDIFMFFGGGVDNGFDTIGDPNFGDIIRITGANFTSGIDAGNGLALGNNEIEIEPGEGNSTLHIGTDSIAGADLTIKLSGVYDPSSFSISGSDITILSEAPPSGDDTLSGGPGNDWLSGRSGNDLIFGFAGIDTLIGGSDNDTLLGGDDNDAITGGDGNDSINGEGGDDQISGDNGADTIDGGPGDDTLFDEFPHAHSVGGADSVDDLLSGGDGNDYIFSFAGNDTAIGGAGRDLIAGPFALSEAGDGDDTVRAFGHLVYGNSGNDSLIGSQVYGGSGNDSIECYEGYGGNGEDTLSGHSPVSMRGGQNLLDGGADNDLLVGDGDNPIQGGASDTLIGGGGRDTLYGDGLAAFPTNAQTGAGNDALYGGLGNDVFMFFGGGVDNGDDTIGDPNFGDIIRVTGANFTSGVSAGNGTGLGNDEIEIETGGGNSTLRIGTDSIAGPDITIALAGVFDPSDFSASGTDITFESAPPGGVPIIGSSGPDSIQGGSGPEMIHGAAGPDTIRAGGGPDLVYGNQHDDLVFGDDGPDTAYGGKNDDTMFGGAGADSLFGNGGRDEVSGDEGADVAYGNQQDDEIMGGADADTLYGGQDDDLVRGGSGGDVLFGNKGEDLLYGDAGADVVYGNQGADILYGGADGDTLYGGQGNDELFGSAGDDLLFGNKGDDTLEGGSGDDIFAFGTGQGDNVITDFTTGQDVIQITGATVQELLASVTSTAGGDALISFDGTTITLEGVAPGDVDADFFVVFV